MCTGSEIVDATLPKLTAVVNRRVRSTTARAAAGVAVSKLSTAPGPSACDAWSCGAPAG